MRFRGTHTWGSIRYLQTGFVVARFSARRVLRGLKAATTNGLSAPAGILHSAFCILHSAFCLCLLLAALSPAGAGEPTRRRNLNDEPLSEGVRLMSQQSRVPVRVVGSTAKLVRLNITDTPVEKALLFVSRQAGMTVRKEGDGYVLEAAAAAAPAKTPRAPAIPAAEIIAGVKPFVVLVLAYLPAERAFAQGTGFLASADGLVVTNAHVVKGASPLLVAFQDKAPCAAVLAATDEALDLAVLRIARRPEGHAKLGDSDEVREGEDVALTGYPMAAELVKSGIPVYASTAKATINAVRPAPSPITGDPMTYLQFDAPVNPGNSGGPLFRLDNGKVIGVVQSKFAYDQTQDTGLSFAIPINPVYKLLQEARKNPVAPPNEASTQTLSSLLPLWRQQVPGDGPALETPSGGTAITRPFDLLPSEPARPIPEPPASPGVMALYAPGGRMLADPARPRLYAADTGGNSVVLMDTEHSRVLRRIFTGSKPHGLALSPDGKMLYVANSGGSEITLVDVEKMEAAGRIPLSFRPFDLAIGPSGRVYATAAGAEPASLRAIDLRRQMEVPVAGAPLPGGSLLAGTTAGNALFAIDRADAPAALFQCGSAGKVTPAAVPDAGVLGANAQDLALSPDGSRLYVASLSLGYVSVLDADSLRPLGQLEVGGPPTSVAVSPDGQTAYVCHRKSHLDRFDTQTFLRTGSLPLPDAPLRVVASPDGKRVYIQMGDGILIRDVSSFGRPAPEN